MTLRIGLDVDGVLADVITSWLSFSNKKRPIILKSQISEWDFWRDHGIDKFDFYNELSICWKSWETMPPTENNLAHVTTQLSNLGTVDIVTAREESTHDDVKNWLKLHKINFKNYVGVLEGIEKSHLDYDVFIDDSPLNAKSMLDKGKSVILYSQPWNESFNDNRATRIHELQNAVPVIDKMLDENK